MPLVIVPLKVLIGGVYGSGGDTQAAALAGRGGTDVIGGDLGAAASLRGAVERERCHRIP